MQVIWRNSTPEQQALFHDVYVSVTTQPWFGTSKADREWFALQIASFYNRGVTDPIDLWQICDRTARSRYEPVV